MEIRNIDIRWSVVHISPMDNMMDIPFGSNGANIGGEKRPRGQMCASGIDIGGEMGIKKWCRVLMSWPGAFESINILASERMVILILEIVEQQAKEPKESVPDIGHRMKGQYLDIMVTE